MASVRRVNDSFQPTWELTQQLLLGLQEHPGTQVSLEVDDETWFVIEYVHDFGYYMSGCGPTNQEYLNLIDSSLGDEITEGCLVHQMYSFTRYALVGQELLLRAAKTFFELGIRDPECEWVSEENTTYD